MPRSSAIKFCSLAGRSAAICARVRGVVGTEINFNREFYVYQPPRTRAQIAADIHAKEQKFMELLRGIQGGDAA